MANPKLRFKAADGTEYPEWEQMKICDAAEVNPKSLIVPDCFYYIDLESVKQGKVICELVLMNKGNAPSRAKRVVSTGDVLFQSVRPYQRNNLFLDDKFDGAFVASTGYAVLRAKQSYLANFIYYVVHTDNFLDQVLMQCDGGTYPSISSMNLKNICIDVPCLEEQRKIADFLSTFDDKVEAKEQQLEALQETKKGLLQQIFSQQLRFKADDGTEFPEWGSTTLNKQGVFIRGLSYKKQNVVDDHTKTLVLRSSNILQFGKLDYLNKCQFVNKQPLPNQILQKGDIVICMANGSAHLVGKASCYEGGYQTGNLTVGAFCSIYRQHTFPIAKYIFQTQSYLNFILENSQGGNGAISNIKPSTYEDFECSYPCLEEQRKIAEFLSAFDEKIEAVKRQLEALREIKKGLLQQMFV